MQKYLLTILFLLGVSVSSHAFENEQCGYWPQWEDFKKTFVNKDGRVIDLGSKENITTSEGQSYGLFFALVANDKQAFDKMLDWTERYLSEGDLSARLPAWLWGKKSDGTYGILDSNPASDSDLWIAYALTEASRLWDDRRYAVLASVMNLRIIREETVDIPNLGLTLLPGPYGFELANQTWKLNPSYLPLQIFKRFVSVYPNSPWQDLYNSSYRILLESSQKGFSPDWVLYNPNKGFHFDKETTDLGSYNAIRTYLWIGLMNEKSEYKEVLVRRYAPITEKFSQNGYPPENTYALSGKSSGKGPAGFSAALLPLLKESYQNVNIGIQSQLMLLNMGQKHSKRYYDSVLSLFGTGALEGRYMFDPEGMLYTKWTNKCL